MQSSLAAATVKKQNKTNQKKQLIDFFFHHFISSSFWSFFVLLSYPPLLSWEYIENVVCWRLARRMSNVKDEYLLLAVIIVYFYVCRHLGLQMNRWISVRAQTGVEMEKKQRKSHFRGKEKKKGGQILWRMAGLSNSPVCWTAERRTGWERLSSTAAACWRRRARTLIIQTSVWHFRNKILRN